MMVYGNRPCVECRAGDLRNILACMGNRSSFRLRVIHGREEMTGVADVM